MRSSTPRPDDSPSPFFLQFGATIVRHRWIWLVLIALITGYFGYRARADLVISNNLHAFAPKSSEMDALDDYRAAFGRDDVFLILIEGDVFSEAFLAKLKTAHDLVKAVDVDVPITSHLSGSNGSSTASSDQDDDFADFDDDLESEDFGDGFVDEDTSSEWAGMEGGSVIEDVISLINARQTTASPGGGIRVEKLLDPMPSAAQLKDVRTRALADPTIAGRLVGAAGRHTVIVARTFQMRDEDMEEVYDEFKRVLAPLNDSEFVVQITGQPAINAAMNQMVIQDTGTLVTWSFLAMLIVLALIFRHPIGILGPIIVVGLSVVWLVGLMAEIGYGLTILSMILPSFLLCVGIGDSVHMLSIYRDLRSSGLGNNDAIIRAIGVTGPPVLFTSITTMCGLLSLNFASVPAIAEMGIAGGIGVIFAFLLSITLLPIILTFNKKSLLGARPDGSGHGFVDGALNWMDSLSNNKLGPNRLTGTLVVTVLLAITAGIGVARLGVWHDDLSTVPDDAEVKIAVKTMDKHVGGVASANLLIKPASDRGMKDLALLQGIEKVSNEIEGFIHPEHGAIVGHSMSVVDVVKETRRAFRGGDQAAYRLPDTQGETNDLMFLFENQGPDELRRLATLNLDTSHLTFQVKWAEATSYGPFIEAVERSVAEHIGSLATVTGTGGVYLMHRIVLTLLDDLIRSFSTAFLFITFLMVFMLRDLRLGLIAMIPNLLPIAFIMGGMGLAGIPIDLNNLLIASIALGIAVDDTIHFLHHFRKAFISSGDCETALLAARHHAGRAMFNTSAILAIGFGIYMQAINQAVARFGVLIGLTVIAALLVDLIILPATLRLVYGRSARNTASPQRR